MKKITAIVLSAILAIFVCYEADTYIHPRSARAASQFATILCDNFKPISNVTSNTQIITAGGTNQFIYICSYNLTNGNAAAQQVSIVEGTGTTCASNTLAVSGNTTAANGLALGINGGISYGGGIGAVVKTAVAGDNVCLFAGAGPISGSLSWTSAPF